MVDFRRWFIALAVPALMVGVASGQVGISGGSQAGPLACSARAASNPQLRQEGFTELLGDILILCTGGPTYQAGTVIPTTNITVYVTSVLSVTSRLFNPIGGLFGGLSEALLLIDEPGSGLPTGATGSYGPNAPQVLCSDPVGCPSYAELDVSGSYTVASSNQSGVGPNAANVYQGYIGLLGANTVTFFGVPVLPPVWTGVSRVFRITNVRVPAVGLGNAQTISVSVSTSPSTVLPVPFGSLVAGVVIGPSLTTIIDQSPVGGKSPFGQCAAPLGAMLTAQVHFIEGFATAFKTRVVPLSNTEWASTVPNTGSPGQNIPGSLYAGFTSNSESGFIMPTDTATVGGNIYTAGLADFGTRLKAVFTNIPAGVTLYVSINNVNGYPVPGGTSTVPYAVLVAGNQSNESNIDGAVISPLTGAVTGSDGLTAFPLTPDGSGVAAAIWEVVNSNPSANESLTFSVYINYSGLPEATGQVGMPVNNVALSFAPEPGGGSFTQSSGPMPGTNPIPRSDIVNIAQASWVSIVSCTLSVSKTHTGNFTQGQSGATYTVTVANASSGPVSGTVTVTETVPAGMTLVSMAGTGWTCPSGGTTCTRSDALNGGASYWPITVTVNVAANAASQVTNQVSLTGGGSLGANASDITTVLATTPIAVTTNPAGLSLIVDGTTYAAPQSFNWVPGSNHTVNVASPQVGVGARYVFANWSDAGAQSHTIVTPSSTATYTANFTAQYLLTTSVAPSGTGTIAAIPSSGDGYYNSGTSVQLTAIPAAGYAFSAFSGDLTGGINPQTIVMSAAYSVTANFTLIGGAGLRFIPLTPCRVADTRNAAGPFGGPTMAGGVSRDFNIPSGACSVPSTALAYSLNVAVVPGGPLGYLTLWPTGQTQPLASTLNSLDGRIKSNAAIVPAGTGGSISVFPSNATDMVLDINGYFVPRSEEHTS